MFWNIMQKDESKRFSIKHSIYRKPFIYIILEPDSHGEINNTSRMSNAAKRSLLPSLITWNPLVHPTKIYQEFLYL